MSDKRKHMSDENAISWKKCEISTIKKRRTITLEQKLEIIRRSDSGERDAHISRMLNLPRTTVATILKDKARIMEHVKNSASLQSTIITKRRSGTIAEMEKLLVVWLEDQTRRHGHIPHMEIQEKARNLYNNLKRQKNDGEADVESFVASRGWLNRFKARANLQNIIKEEVDSDDPSNSFRDNLASIIVEKGYSSSQVFNVDEVSFYWKKMPSKICANKEEKCASRIRTSKDKVTILIGGNAAGDFKLKPLLIYYSESPKSLKRYSKSFLPVIWKSHSKACMTQDIFQEWYCNNFIPAVEEYCSEHNLAFKALLIIDSSYEHPSCLNNLNDNVKVIFLPTEYASQLQPMNRGISSKFKAFYLQHTFFQALNTFDSSDPSALKEFWENYNICSALKNISLSWDEITSSDMNSVWSCLCPYFVIDFKAFNENLLAIKEKVVLMAKQLGLDEVDLDDIDELVLSHSRNDVPVNFILENNIDQEEDVKTDILTKNLTTEILEEGFQLIESAMTLFQENDPNEERSSAVIKVMSEAYNCYKQIYEQLKEARRSVNNVHVKIEESLEEAEIDL